ncbi:hypothetical protein [Pseudokordiimonas caeni]|uniref:hypothetical protein n=1 Tax=Pseudokordiimonas caeni TaxID=2997908 RepID=UPI0028120CEB|nr:hypothetical protein [Pseudokordiimonas caeni]
MKPVLKFLALGLFSLPAYAADHVDSTLKAGAAKVEFTPDATALPEGYLGILDPVYVRALVLQTGKSKAALVSVDAGAIPDQVWLAASEASAKLGIPREALQVTATHTHSVPRDLGAVLSARIAEALKAADARLEPARIAYGEGVSFINVNRNMIDPETRKWWEGPNYDGPSDKTVAVVKVETTNGQPIALYYNYAVHAVITGQLDKVSGDIPGATSRYIEDALDDRAVALWSEGAAGDQNPIFFQQTYDLREIRIKDFAARGIDISNTMLPGGKELDRSNPAVLKLMKQQEQMIASMGQMLGEEVLHVARSNMNRAETVPVIYGSQKDITCPGRTRTDEGRAGAPGTYVDADPVPIRLSLLRVGDIVIGGVNAEVFNPIAMKFKARSPFARTVMATLTNGYAPSGYIPHDAAYAQYTFEVVSSRLKPGCAEEAIAEGLLDLIEGSEKARLR